MDREQFKRHWRSLPESQSPHALDAAWRRYQHVESAGREREDPSAQEFEAAFDGFLNDAFVKAAIESHKNMTLKANSIPWTATGIHVDEGKVVTTFASGRVWRSKDLDMFLRPQVALWYRVGVNGRIFNSTSDTNTFTAEDAGELYMANQFPGQFGEPFGGRLATPLNVYSSAEGHFQILVIVWKNGFNPQGVMETFASSSAASPRLLSRELDRTHRDIHPSVPPEWQYLWFLGRSSIYSLTGHEGQPCMHCKPDLNTGILQKTFESPLPFSPDTTVSWDWLISSLPSRLREDLTFTHDYLSIAFEFENGRDLTYTWSWELEKGFGYWCPLPAWADREYHVVIRSGTAELGRWLSERRELHSDYVHYIEGGQRNSKGMPRQIVRVWFIAGNRWQRFDGEMSVKKLRIHQGESETVVL